MSSADLNDGGSYSPPHHHGGGSYGHSHSPPPTYHGHRNPSPDYHSGGSPYASGALPARGDSYSHSRPRLEYEQPDIFYAPPAIAAGLAPPRQHHRPRSVPPPTTRDRDRDRDRDRHRRRRDDDDDDDDDDDPHKNSHSPVGKAKHVLHHTFTPSTSGLGVGVLGAIVGGLSAREASIAASQRVGHDKGGEKSNKAALLSTIVGAAVGGFGANALEKRIESQRKKDKDEQDAWEKKWGKDKNRRDDRDREDRDKDRDADRDRDGRGSRDLVRARDRDLAVRDRDREGRDRGRRGGRADDYYTDEDDDYVYDDRRGYRRSLSRHR